jgi:hypothetical protein
LTKTSIPPNLAAASCTVFCFAHIGRDVEHVSPCFVLDLLCGFGQIRFPPCGDDELAAFLPERVRDAKANAFARTANDRDLAPQQ